MYNFKKAMLKNLAGAELNVAPMHIRSLHLINSIDKCTAANIAETMERDKAQITRLINDLISQGFIVKTPNPKDKRSQYLTLTDQGEKVLGEMKKVARKVHKEMHQGIDPKDIENFYRTAAAMTDNLSQQSEDFSVSKHCEKV
jgi:DNA-binding MarR family transcriptional regulator